MKKQTLILFVGRDDWQKDEPLNQTLIRQLEHNQLRIVWEDPVAAMRFKLMKVLPDAFFSGLGKTTVFKRSLQLLYGIRHPGYLKYLYERYNNPITRRCEYLSQFIRKLGQHNEIVILSRSAGGRVSSLIADDLNIKQLICLGYPFEHPQIGDEPERYQHLAHLKTPMLIIQGTRDEYGGADCQQRYPMSPAIEVWFVDTNHNFDLNKPDILRLVNKIESVISGASSGVQTKGNHSCEPNL